MKNSFLFLSVAILALSAMALSCNSDDGISPRGTNQDQTSMEWRSSYNSVLYPPTSQPFGKSLPVWGQEFSKHVVSLDCEGMGGQHLFTLPNNVVAPFFSLLDESMNINLSRDQVFFLPMFWYINDYPCPDPGFVPAEGQTLEDFLQEGIAPYIDLAETIEVTFDGVALGNMTDDFRFISDLYYFTGNPALVDCFDPCITGESQAGVFAGYFIMFKKMKMGHHTIAVHGEIPVYEFEWNITFDVTVQ